MRGRDPEPGEVTITLAAPPRYELSSLSYGLRPEEVTVAWVAGSRYDPGLEKLIMPFDVPPGDASGLEVDLEYFGRVCKVEPVVTTPRRLERSCVELEVAGADVERIDTASVVAIS